MQGHNASSTNTEAIHFINDNNNVMPIIRYVCSSSYALLALAMAMAMAIDIVLLADWLARMGKGEVRELVDSSILIKQAFSEFECPQI